MAHWSATLKASPKTIETTKQILQLMSVGQYLPPPLDSVSDVIEIFHPYQVIFFEITWGSIPLNYGISVPAGINMPSGTFGKMNKRAPWKFTG